MHEAFSDRADSTARPDARAVSAHRRVYGRQLECSGAPGARSHDAVQPSRGAGVREARPREGEYCTDTR